MTFHTVKIWNIWKKVIRNLGRENGNFFLEKRHSEILFCEILFRSPTDAPGLRLRKNAQWSGANWIFVLAHSLYRTSRPTTETSSQRWLIKTFTIVSHGLTHRLLRYSIEVNITNTQTLTNVLIKGPSLVTILLAHIGLINLSFLINMLIVDFWQQMLLSINDNTIL